jgi:hypothetical protein
MGAVRAGNFDKPAPVWQEERIAAKDHKKDARLGQSKIGLAAILFGAAAGLPLHLAVFRGCSTTPLMPAMRGLIPLPTQLC